MNHPLRHLVETRLNNDDKVDDEWGLLVLAALAGSEALERELGQPATEPQDAPKQPDDAPTTGARGAFLKSIAVEGFRGIGPKATLDIPPGPGLTLVVGRNGSGKSSFAEGLEVLLTGDSRRWDQRSAVWREGWRNLHHKTHAVEAQIILEGQASPCRAWREWADADDFDAPVTNAQVHGKPKGLLADLGWTEALQSHRPFLSYNELGSLLEESPSKLYDALSSILGLEDLGIAQKSLRDARLERERQAKATKATRDDLLKELESLPDERATKAKTAIAGKKWDLDALASLLEGAAEPGEPESELGILRRLAGMTLPEADEIDAVVEQLKDAATQLEKTAGTLAARSADTIRLVEQALSFHDTHGDGDCPVCNNPGAFNDAWHEEKAKEVESLRIAAKAVEDARAAGKSARDARASLIPAWDPSAEATKLDHTKAKAAHEAWQQGDEIESLTDLADHVAEHGPAVTEATKALRAEAKTELDRRQDLWRPVARKLTDWLDEARETQADAPTIKRLKAAEAWMKGAAGQIRDERFAPIADKAQEVWGFLRQQSHVELGAIRLAGSSTQRRVTLDVTIDGVEGAALGVMSQGELHALALSLFIPRATLPESPFRFVVIDDPVQSMDPARVDGLAEVLDKTAQDRQVVVFTHDDRLPAAVRRLDIPATILEVTRRPDSVVELRAAKTPVDRYIEDALAVAYTDDLPSEAAKRVVPGLCRLAVEAACTESVRRKQLGNGKSNREVEDALAEANKLTQLAALALFDDAGRGGDVLPRLNKAKREYADVFRACNEGAHKDQHLPMVDLTKGAERLATWLRGVN